MSSTIRVGKILVDDIKSQNGTPAITSDAAGQIDIPNLSANINFEKREVWNTAGRPAAAEGVFGFNTDVGYIEIYRNGAWKNINDFNEGNYVKQNLLWFVDPSNPASYPGTGSILYDLSGNGYDATISGAVYRGYSFYYDGSNDTADVPVQVIPPGTQLTFEQWILGESNRASTSFEAKDANNIRTLNLHLTWSNSSVYFDSGGTDGYDRISKGVRNYGEYRGWHCWTFTKNSATGSMKIYLDGVLWHSGTGLNRNIGTTTKVNIGSYTNGSSRHHQGNIGVMRSYNRELSAAEVLQNYNASRYIYQGGL
jgi:hypothetical protein